MRSIKTVFKSLGFSACRKYGCILLLSAIGLAAHSQDTSITVISNPVGAPGTMNLNELRSVLKGERQRWSDKEKTKVIIVMMKTTTPIGKNACSKIYHMDPDAVAKFWFLLEFVQKARVKTCNSVSELEAYVADNPGAIGVTGKFSDAPNIKVTTIDGKKSF